MVNLLHSAAKVRKAILIVETGQADDRLLAQVLGSEDDFAVCGTVYSAKQAFQTFSRNCPDLVLIDLRRTERAGLNLIRRIRSVDRNAKILVISVRASQTNPALQAGADGCISAYENSEELAFAIRDVLAGHIYVSEAAFSGAAEESLKSPVKRGVERFSKTTRSRLQNLTEFATDAIASKDAVATPAKCVL